VAQALQRLWNQALDSAHEALGETVSTRERSLAERESALDTHTQKILEQEQVTVARATALEESVALARDQLLAANQRADRLETSLQAREAECARLQTRIDDLEAAAVHLRTKLDAAAAVHHAERTKLEERHAAAEARWLNEVDRARQSAKETAKEQERQSKELRAQIHQLQAQGVEFKQDLQEARSELRTATTARTQLEKRLAAVARARGNAQRTASSKPMVRRKRQ
jgi:chromosome segregation ATPase